MGHVSGTALRGRGNLAGIYRPPPFKIEEGGWGYESSPGGSCAVVQSASDVASAALACRATACAEFQPARADAVYAAIPATRLGPDTDHDAGSNVASALRDCVFPGLCFLLFSRDFRARLPMLELRAGGHRTTGNHPPDPPASEALARLRARSTAPTLCSQAGPAAGLASLSPEQACQVQLSIDSIFWDDVPTWPDS